MLHSLQWMKMNASSAVQTGSTCGQRTSRKQTKIVGGTVATVETHPWGRRHILAQQVQREGVPLWRESDFILLVSHSSPLLSWRVGTHSTYWIQRGWDLILDQSQGCIGTKQYSWSISVVPAIPLSETSKASKISCTFGWSRTLHTSIHFYLCGDFNRNNLINPNHPS